MRAVTGLFQAWSGLICQSGQNWAAKIARSTIRTFLFEILGTQGKIRTKLQNLSGQNFEISDPASRPIDGGPPMPLRCGWLIHALRCGWLIHALWPRMQLGNCDGAFIRSSDDYTWASIMNSISLFDHNLYSHWLRSLWQMFGNSPVLSEMSDSDLNIQIDREY
jgi:hypothetical protein